MPFDVKALVSRLRQAATKTPLRTAATVGATGTAAGIAGAGAMGAFNGTPKLPEAPQVLQGMSGGMNTTLERQPVQTPAMAPSASGTTQAPGMFSGKRIGATGAKLGLAGAVGAAAGFGAGALSGRKAKKKQPGNMGKTSFGTKQAMDPMVATGVALPGVLGLVGAARGFAGASPGKRLKGAGRGAVKGVGGGLGALAGLAAGGLGGLSAGAALEGRGHPDAAALAQRGLTFGGGLAGHAMGSGLAERLVGNEETDNEEKYGSDRGTTLSRLASRRPPTVLG